MNNIFYALVFFMMIMTGAAADHDETHTRVVVLGDSLTKGHGVSPEDAFPTILEEMLRSKGYDVRIINAGISGSTTSGGLARLEWLMEARPNIVIIALGANDGLRGKSLVKMRDNLSAMIHYAKDHGAEVVLAGMRLPHTYDKAYREEYEAVFITLAEENGLVLIPFLLEGVAGNRSLNLSDGIHPNEEGHRIMAATVYQYLEPMLAKAFVN